MFLDKTIYQCFPAGGTWRLGSLIFARVSLGPGRNCLPEGAEPFDTPEDVGIILERVMVLSELRNVLFALAILLAFVYYLNPLPAGI